MNNEILRFRLGQAMLFVGPLTSLVINPWGNFDPISVVKLTAVSTMAFFALFLILSNWRITSNAERSLLLSLILFFIGLFSTFLFSGAPLNQQFWGMFGRNTGVLAYISLGIILFATAIVLDDSFYTKITNALILTAVPMTFYCLVQISGNDPIGWSSFEAFGTLGNINFLSAFLGLTCVAIIPKLVTEKQFTFTKLLLLSLLLTDIFIIQSTGSTQGIFVFVAGSSIVTVLKLKSERTWNMKQLIFIVSLIAVSIPTVAGLINKGPLASYLFQNSIILRTDYWHAGLEMTQRHPFFGVGMDSYGDWYRETRGEITTLRGSPDRTANTAHNIFLDLSSNGGVPLLIGYLALLFLAFRASVQMYKSLGSNFDPVFAALFATWVGYQVQALVSINQIGVGVWGWLLTGALIGLGKTRSSSNSQASRPINRKNLKNKLLPAFSSILGITGISLGFLLAWFPLNADSKYFSASKSRDRTSIEKAVELPGSTAWHLARSAETAAQSQQNESALSQAQKLVERYPRDFFGWRLILFLPNASAELKSEALSRLHALDPFNPEYKR